MLRTSAVGIALICSFEGFFAEPYNDPAGHATVGYGHLLHYGAVTSADRRGVWLRGQRHPGRLTRGEAKRLLRRKLAERYEPAVRALRLPLNQNQFDALVSFVYNVGPGAIGPTTGIGVALRNRQWRRAADELLRWDKAGGRTLAGLTRRRHAERDLFLKPPPIQWTRRERRLMRRKLTPRTRRLLRRQARRVLLAARATPGGWRRRDRSRRFQALRRRARAID